MSPLDPEPTCHRACRNLLRPCLSDLEERRGGQNARPQPRKRWSGDSETLGTFALSPPLDKR